MHSSTHPCRLADNNRVGGAVKAGAQLIDSTATQVSVCTAVLSGCFVFLYWLSGRAAHDCSKQSPITQHSVMRPCRLPARLPADCVCAAALPRGPPGCVCLHHRPAPLHLHPAAQVGRDGASAVVLLSTDTPRHTRPHATQAACTCLARTWHLLGLYSHCSIVAGVLQSLVFLLPLLTTPARLSPVWGMCLSCCRLQHRAFHSELSLEALHRDERI